MKIQWLGHAAFLITANDGTKILTDPYKPADNLKYGSIREKVDVVTTSHEHGDHGYTAELPAQPQVLRGAGSKEAKGITFKGVATSHDVTGGSQRGSNVVFCFAVDNVRLCHLGDLGHGLSQAQISEIGPVDVLLTPVGGFYTIDAAVASQVVNQLEPKVVIPMHFRNDKCLFPIATVDDFLKGKPNVRHAPGSEVEFMAGSLPATTEIVVLKPAL